MANEGPITKIYQIKVLGFDESKVEFDKMSIELSKLKKAKQDLDKELAKTTSPAQMAQLNKTIQAQVTLEADLTKRIQEKNREIQLGQALEENNGTEGIGAAMIAYQNLIKQYKEAKANSEAMELQFGKESEQAIEAARSFALYESELLKINALRKGNIKASPTATPDATPPAVNAAATSEAAVATNELTGAYDRLKQQFKEADLEAKNLAAEFGVTSEQAIKAAESAAAYKQQLNEINALSKTVTTPKAETAVPFTTNLNPDGTVIQPALVDATTALNEYDKAQIEVANSAAAMGQSQLDAAAKVEVTETAFVAVKGSLDQYTGSLRDNIRAQIENANSLAANRAAQKEINDAIKESGSASEAQVERLAALKEEAVILDQSNKTLSTTIRNQAREFVAANGSLEEGRAKVNQLQQAYAQLSETERDQPFGQSIKQEIDIIEPKVKELEASIGLFQRNVGNYPSTFTGAFKVLETELDTLQGKLIKGNFTGKEFDEVTKKTAVLNEVTQTLNTTFKTTTQEQSAYKEAARQVASTFGTESVVFQNFSKEVQAGNTKLKETDIALNAVSGTGKKAGNIFQTMFSALRTAANILPGIGMSGLILLLIAPLEALASKVADYASKATLAGKNTEDLKKRLEEMKTAVHESEKEFVTATTNVESLRINVDLAKQGFLSKDGVLKQYNETLGKTYGQVKNLDEVERIITKNGEAYIQMMLLKAAANQALEAAAKKAFEAEEIRRKTPLEARTIGDQVEDILGSIGAGAGAGRTAQVADQNRKLTEQKNRESQQRQIQDLKNAEKQQVDIAKKFQQDAAAIAKQTGADLLGGIDTKKTKEHADRLSKDEQNALKIIDATLKTELAVENERFNEIEKNHSASYDEEIIHLKRVEEINVNALNSKIKLLTNQKKLNAEELATLADFKEKRSSIELQTSKQIQDIEKKRFADQNKDLQAGLDANIAQAKQAQQKVLDNPNTSNVDRARANLQFIDTEIVAYKQYYNQLLDLNDNYSKEELQKVRDHVKALSIERNRGLNEDLVAHEKDLELSNQNEIRRIDIQYEEIRQTVLKNDNLTVQQRERNLAKLERAHQRTILSAEVDHLTKETNEMFILFAKGLKTEEEYLKKLGELNKKKGDLQASLNNQPNDNSAAEKAKPSDIGGLLGEGVKKLFPKLDDAEMDEVNKAIAGSFSLATDAMHNYYDAERARIQQSLELNLARLDLEEQQVKARAQSQAEIDSIDKQYAAKKVAAQKAAGEETKKTKRAELKIALVTELANDAVAAAAYPFPFSLAIFGVMSALALGRYALGVSQINAQQFAYGGDVPKRGGKFGGKPHSQGGTKFGFQREQYEAEVDELAIIRTRNAPARNKVFQIQGTHQQIASQLNVIGGGVSFAPGAKLKRFDLGGSLATTLQAPVFTPSSNSSIINNSNGVSKDQFEMLIGKIDTMNAETSKRFERIEVVQVTSSVTRAQQKQVQQKAIGTL